MRLPALLALLPLAQRHRRRPAKLLGNLSMIMVMAVTTTKSVKTRSECPANLRST